MGLRGFAAVGAQLGGEPLMWVVIPSATDPNQVALVPLRGGGLGQRTGPCR